MLKTMCLSTLGGILVASAVHAQSIIGYDIVNVRASGTGSFTHTYSGLKTPTVGPLFNYSGGGGTLNDGSVASTQNGIMSFQASDNSVLTLFLSGTFQLSSLTLFGGNLLSPPNIIPGKLTGATIGFGGVSLALASAGTGLNCFSGKCDDTFNFAGTALAGLSGNTITLSNFQGGFVQSGETFFTITEISAAAPQSTVPEPATLVLMLVGGATLAVVSRRRFTQVSTGS